MKLLIISILAMSCCVSSYRHLETISGYDVKTVHEIKPYKVVPQEKLEDDVEAKLEALNKMLKEHQQQQQKAMQSRKTEVSLKTEVQSEAGVEKAIEYEVPNYEFGYGVKDPKTGDQKEQWEKRVGDRVKGTYKFAESDGTQRVVEYEADDEKGFEAKVKNVEKLETGQLDEKVKGDIAHSYSYLKKISS
ncbi:uncharacterized protein LOC131438785 [Malaya genurostris]|uniref:uncharacterized protein LOC131438785 n=1 Tax=Malaya genurostris TaxID=325434 RepID=UPI0026F3BE15|nr:uncharacterized protein LOC131438785 [Malaya genurostris]